MRPTTTCDRRARACRAPSGLASCRARAVMGLRGATRVAVDAGPVRDRHVPAGVSRDRCRIRRVGDRDPADAFTLSVRLRLHDAVARRAVGCVRAPAGRAGRPRDLRPRLARLRDRGQHRVAVAVPHAAGSFGRRRSRRRACDHPRSISGTGGAAPDVADHAGVRHRAGIRAGDRRRAAQPARLARDLLADADVRARCARVGCA